MKIYKNLAFLCIILLSACSKDLGNYDYHEINEVSIKGVSSTYLVRTGIDTLRISPTIEGSIDMSDFSRYDFNWILKKGTRDFDTISREKNLSYPIKLNAVLYDLFYRITDKSTGVSWVANSKINVSTAYSKGLLIMGEDEGGFAEIEMLSMLTDTLHVKHILANSDIPPLRDPVSLFHTGGTVSSNDVRLWAMTKTGSYFLDRAMMTTTVNNTLSRVLFLSEEIDPATLNPVVIAPQIINAAGGNGSFLYRALVTSGGDIFANAPILMGGDFYNNPVNRIANGPNTRLQAAPYLLYPIGSMNNFMWYDIQNNRFLNFTSIYVGTTATVLVDKDEDVFPWNQPAGRSLAYAENTRNTDGGSTQGNSFAIMKNTDNTNQIYKFYTNGANPAKHAAYEVKPMATDFHKADHYAFSSNRSVVFYSVGSKLYAYDYNPGFEKIYQFPEFGSDEITMLKFDTQFSHVTNSLYIATYNNLTKGTLQRFRVGTDPNVVELLTQPNSSWSNMVKVKDVNWRGTN